MKLIPSSKAASTHARAASRSTPPEYVSHEPRLISDTEMSLAPSWRYCTRASLPLERPRLFDRAPRRVVGSRKTAMRAPIDPRLKIGAVRLAVADLARSIAFYG